MAESPSTRLFVIHAGQETGPLQFREVMERLRAGSLALDDLCWLEGAEDRAPLRLTLPKLGPPLPVPGARPLSPQRSSAHIVSSPAFISPPAHTSTSDPPKTAAKASAKPPTKADSVSGKARIVRPTRRVRKIPKKPVPEPTPNTGTAPMEPGLFRPMSGDLEADPNAPMVSMPSVDVSANEEVVSAPSRNVTASTDNKESADSLHEKVVIRAADSPPPFLSRLKVNVGMWGWIIALGLLAVLLFVIFLRPHQPTAPQTKVSPAPAPSISWAPTPETVRTPSSAANAEAVSKKAPFVNSLRMRFVPVPGVTVLFSVWDTQVQDYQEFVNATGRYWPEPSSKEEAAATHPAVRVNWDDAKAFCKWLTQKERSGGWLQPDQEYRLPTDAEWSAAVGLGYETGRTPKEKDRMIDNVYPWGEKWPPPKGAGNYAPSLLVDDYMHTSPVGSFGPNQYGLYDMSGNVWQWCEDSYDENQTYRVLRGQSWYENSQTNSQSAGRANRSQYLSSYRYAMGPNFGFDYVGFRCVVAPSTPTAEKSPALVSEATPITNNAEAEVAVVTATKEQPFVNSLGMKFVPVAPTQVLFSVWDTRVQDYDAFVTVTKRNWRNPSFGQGPTDPAVNVSWDDATAFCLWLTEKERKEGRLPNTKEYRLASDIEWSQAVGLNQESGNTPKERDAKIKQIYPWGAQWPPPKNVGNYGARLGVDPYEFTSPVGSFRPNKFGLCDMGGNVWQWCEDWFDDSHRGRVLRGASHGGVDPVSLLSSFRAYSAPETGSEFFGFRCVLATSASTTTSDVRQLSQPSSTAYPLPGERFLQTRSVLLTASEVQTWSAEDIQYAINEMYARHGADFPDSEIKRNFSAFAWYNPQPGATYDETEKLFSPLETDNLKLLGFYRDARKGGVSPTGGPKTVSRPTPPAAHQVTQDYRLVYTPPPAYPAQADKAHVTGSGRFRISFDERGNAKSVDVVKSTGSPVLDRNTINALKHWRAAPGSPSTIVVPIIYE